MKKQKILFGLASLTLLTSCGPQEITDLSKLADIKHEITNKRAEIKNYEMVGYVKQTEVSKKTREKKTVNGELLYRVNQDGEMQFYVTQDGMGQDNRYLVKDKTYEKLIYCDSYSFFNGQITVIDYKDHQSTFETYYNELFAMNSSFIEALTDANTIMTFANALRSGLEEFDSETKYYSSKEGQLTIKIDDVSTKEGDDTKNHFEFNYDGYVFQDAKFTHAYSNDDYVRNYEYSFVFKVRDSVNITLPTGWESHLIKDN